MCSESEYFRPRPTVTTVQVRPFDNSSLTCGMSKSTQVVSDDRSTVDGWGFTKTFEKAKTNYHNLRMDLNPRNSKFCASWMSVWNISANYVLVSLKFNLNWNIWKPYLKSSPLDFSGQRLGNTSLVVFLRFHSFSLVVKWPEFVRVYDSTNMLTCGHVKLAQWTEVRWFFRRSWVHSRSGVSLLQHICYTSACILSSKPNNFGKDSHPKPLAPRLLLCLSMRNRRESNKTLWLDNRTWRPLVYAHFGMCHETTSKLWSLMGFLSRVYLSNIFLVGLCPWWWLLMHLLGRPWGCAS